MTAGAQEPGRVGAEDTEAADEVIARRERRAPGPDGPRRVRHGPGYDPALERLAALRTLYPRAYAHLDPRLREACEAYTRTRRRPWLPEPAVSDDGGEVADLPDDGGEVVDLPGDGGEVVDLLDDGGEVADLPDDGGEVVELPGDAPPPRHGRGGTRRRA